MGVRGLIGGENVQKFKNSIFSFFEKLRIIFEFNF